MKMSEQEVWFAGQYVVDKGYTQTLQVGPLEAKQ
jgi:hypothetical protein